METPRTIVLPRALPHQLPLLTSDARFKLAVCGRRWGKTVAGLLACLLGHGSRRGSLCGAIDGGMIWWVAPTYGIATEIWNQVKRSTQDAWIDKSETERRVVLPGGGSVSIKSADNPDAMRGVGLDGLVIDEAAFVEERAWKEVLRPTLADKQGWAMLIGTPNGCNWLFNLFEESLQSLDWGRWQLPTAENPVVTPAELESLRNTMGDREFSQEHMAQFVDVKGAEFSGAYFGDSIWFDDWPTIQDVQYRVMALDPSKGKTNRSDYSAYIMLALHRNGTMYVDADLQRRDVWQIVRDGIEIAKWFQPHAFGVEVNQFQEMFIRPFAEQGLAAGIILPIHGITNTLDKKVRIRSTLTPFLARGEIKFRRGSQGAKLLVEQLRLFPIQKFNDDGPDALEMAVSLTRHVFQNGLEAA